MKDKHLHGRCPGCCMSEPSRCVCAQEGQPCRDDVENGRGRPEAAPGALSTNPAAVKARRYYLRRLEREAAAEYLKRVVKMGDKED